MPHLHTNGCRENILPPLDVANYNECRCLIGPDRLSGKKDDLTSPLSLYDMARHNNAPLFFSTLPQIGDRAEGLQSC